VRYEVKDSNSIDFMKSAIHSYLLSPSGQLAASFGRAAPTGIDPHQLANATLKNCLGVPLIWINRLPRHLVYRLASEIFQRPTIGSREVMECLIATTRYSMKSIRRPQIRIADGRGGLNISIRP